MKKIMFAIAIISALISMGLTTSAFDSGLEHLTLDLRFNLFPETESVNDSIIIISVDDASLESMNWLGPAVCPDWRLPTPVAVASRRPAFVFAGL
jgi:CHASE2 domain-containing sensor protein